MSDSNSISLPKDKRFKDLTGKVFTRLTVLGYAGRSSTRKSLWNCRCVCGSIKTVDRSSLMQEQTKSCGCLSSEMTSKRNLPKHGMSGKSEYQSWVCMWARCTNPKDLFFHLYECRRPPEVWRDFSVFYAELGPKPTPKHTLERIDNDKPYGPGNCRWATNKEQTRNKSNNRLVDLNGKATPLVKACEEVGINYSAAWKRLSRGMPWDTPSRPRT